MIHLPFPWNQKSLADLKGNLQDSKEKIVQLTWYWEPFHRPGFNALKFAQKKGMTRKNFEEKVGHLSCPSAPSWLNSKIKKEMQKENVLGEEGEIKPLAPEKFIQKTFEECRFDIESFKDARLFSTSDLKMFFEENSLPFQPVAEGLVEVTELSNWLTPHLDLLKSFHGLKVWDQLEFLEMTMGLFKSSTVLNFTRIY